MSDHEGNYVNDSQPLAKVLRKQARPLTHDIDGCAPLFDRIGDAKIVLIGEASHGTHEFYQIRGQITQKLIRDHGFTAVAVEADFPDAFRVNRYVRGSGKDETPEEALSDFRRFPRWMWRNTDVADFIHWLRAHNAAAASPAGFYGLDLYSLRTSIEAVIRYLENVDPLAAKRARYRYGCFDHYDEDPHTYGHAVSIGISGSCEDEAVTQLLELRARASQYIAQGAHNGTAEDAFFFAEQNARLATSAERYYRTMFDGRVESWNVRDAHMAETLAALKRHLDARQGGDGAKLVVWAHNSHLGDARATSMGSAGEWNLGQLARKAYGDAVVNIGFTTYTGTVAAASNWDAPLERKRVRPALPESYEAVFHELAEVCAMPRFLLITRDQPKLRQPRLQRAIGVIYRPETERISHYFEASLARQFDVVIHIDETHAIAPLDRTPDWDTQELMHTFPAGM